MASVHYFLLIATITFMVVFADDDSDEMFTSTNKVDCVNKMVDWCNGIQYPKDGTGVSMLSIAITDESGAFWRYFCASDSDGTNCTRNGSPWFSCNSDHKMSYKNVELKKDSTEGVDDEICNTTQRAFNDLFVQNLYPSPTNLSTELNKGMESFFQVLSSLQEQLDALRDSIFNNGCFPFCLPRNPYSANPNSVGWPKGQQPATDFPTSESDDRNQLEREK